MFNIGTILVFMLWSIACSQAKFGGNQKKDEPKAAGSDLGQCSEADKAAGKCTGDDGDANPELTPGTDCTDLTSEMCKEKKERENHDTSFRNVNCQGIDAKACEQEVNRAIADDHNNQSEIRVLGCREDSAKTCEKIDGMKNGEKGEVVLVDKTTKDPNGDLVIDSGSVKAPNFAFLVNDPQCAMCHVRFNGNVVSTAPLKGVRADSVGHINGNWYAASTWESRIPEEAAAKPAEVPQINFVGGKLFTNYKGHEIPHTADGKPVFPEFSSSEAESKAYGELNGKRHTGEVIQVKKVHKGLLTLVGTVINPIKISGEVYVDGDLVIKGYYKGVGTIYASGNVYIPGNLRALKSAFPFNDDPSNALKEAKAKLEGKDLYDALAIASQKSILVGDLEQIEGSQVINPKPGATCVQKDAANNCLRYSDYYRETRTVYTVGVAPAGRTYDELGVKNIYSQVGGKAEFDKLYDASYVCQDVTSFGGLGASPGMPAVAAIPGFAATGRGGFDLIEAFLYAKNTVGGISRRNSYSINGGIIADHMHIISGASGCRTNDAHPIHGRPMKNSYVNFDYRIRAGLPLMKLLRRYFEPVEAAKDP